MRRRQVDRSHCRGHLPEEGYLANPFVPYQQDNAPQYEPQKALVRGTIHPGLDLPFHGMVNKQELPVTALSELQVLAFMIQDLALYLDTHRDDQQALQQYQDYQKRYHKCLKEYTRNRGQMNHRTPSEGSYRWLDDPWPWEYAKNREG